MSKEYSTDWNQAAAVLDEARIMHLALTGDDGPYCLPVNFARKGRHIYLHSGTSGKKLDMLAKDNRVCFSAQADVRLKTASLACNWGYDFRSVVGFGTVDILTDETERRHGLETIVHKWAGKAMAVNEKIFAAQTLVLRINVSEATLRTNG